MYHLSNDSWFTSCIKANWGKHFCRILFFFYDFRSRNYTDQRTWHHVVSYFCIAFGGEFYIPLFIRPFPYLRNPNHMYADIFSIKCIECLLSTGMARSDCKKVIGSIVQGDTKALTCVINNYYYREINICLYLILILSYSKWFIFNE